MAAPCTDHLFLTGDKGVGKSTLARCLLAGHTPCGFRTVRVTGVLDRPSVHLLPAVGGVPSAENLCFTAALIPAIGSTRWAQRPCVTVTGTSC